MGKVLPVPQHNAAHIAHTQAVHHHLAGRHIAQLPHVVFVKFQHVANVPDEDVLPRHSHGHGQTGVLAQVFLLSVNRDKVLGPGQRLHQFQLFLAGVAGHVHVVHALVDHRAILLEQLIHHGAHGLLVAGDGPGGNDDEVVGVDGHLPVVGKGHAGQGGHGLPLAAGGDEHQLARLVPVDHVQVDEYPIRHMEVAQLAGNAHHVDHAPPRQGHFAAVLYGAVDDHLHPADGGGKGGHNNALSLRPHKQGIQRVVHRLLGLGVTGALRVGGVCQQGQNPFPAQFREAGQVDHPALCRRHVDFKVAGVDNGSPGRVDGQGHRIGNGVVHMNQLHIHAAQLNVGACRRHVKLGGAVQVVLLQLALNQPNGQRRAVHRHVQLFQQIGYRANVVLMAVGDHHAPNFVPVFFHKGKIGDDAVHPGHILIGEGEAAVHNEHVVLALVYREVFADLVEAAQKIHLHRGFLAFFRPAAAPAAALFQRCLLLFEGLHLGGGLA